MFISRRRGGSSRFTVWKVTILFLGAGIWLGGVVTENFQVTAAAIIVVGIGLLLALVERAGSRSPEGEMNGEPEEAPEEPDPRP